MLRLRSLVLSAVLLLILLAIVFALRLLLSPFILSKDRIMLPGSNLSVRIIEGYSAVRVQGGNNLIIENRENSTSPHFIVFYEDITNKSEEDILEKYFDDSLSAPEVQQIDGVLVFYSRYEESSASLTHELVTPAKAYIITGSDGYLITSKSAPEDAQLTSDMLAEIIRTVERSPPDN